MYEDKTRFRKAWISELKRTPYQNAGKISFDYTIPKPDNVLGKTPPAGGKRFIKDVITQGDLYDLARQNTEKNSGIKQQQIYPLSIQNRAIGKTFDEVEKKEYQDAKLRTLDRANTLLEQISNQPGAARYTQSPIISHQSLPGSIPTPTQIGQAQASQPFSPGTIAPQGKSPTLGGTGDDEWTTIDEERTAERVNNAYNDALLTVLITKGIIKGSNTKGYKLNDGTVLSRKTPQDKAAFWETIRSFDDGTFVTPARQKNALLSRANISKYVNRNRTSPGGGSSSGVPATAP